MPLAPSKIIFAAALIAICAFSAASAQTTNVDPRIRLNSAGFLPNFPKKATIAAKCAEFSVVNSVTGNVMFTGHTDSAYNSDTRESVWLADFSEFNTANIYYLEVPGVGKSANFMIAGTAFKNVFRTMMLGMYLWRCGTAVNATYSGVQYAHPACHTNDGNQKYVVGGDIRKDATSGWHDAGDYNKYVVNSGITVGLMLKAWEHSHFALDTISLTPVSKSGNIPPYLVEIKWNLDWVAKMQLADGKVSHKMTTLQFGSNIMPNLENDTRYFMPWSTPATGSFVGMLAQAARIYAPYDKTFADSCLAKARRSYNTLMASPVVEPDTITSKTGHYYQPDDADKRLWAAAEMWETTGESRYLEYLESNLPENAAITEHFNWNNVSNLATLTYISSKRQGRDAQKVGRLQDKLITIADGFVATAGRHGYGRPMGTGSYYWGANGTIAGTAYILNTAYKITGDDKYRHTIQDVSSHLLGRNVFGRSLVTGIGHRPPQNPHDRRSMASNTPWPGYLIGGPHNGKPNDMKCAVEAACWSDDASDYYTNEIAINWNAAMLYALSCLLPNAGALPAPNYPGQPDDNGVPVRYAAPNKTTNINITGTTRIARTRNGRLDIPLGAKVYTLNGKLVAHRRGADSKMPVLSKNGVFIIKVEAKTK
jgi:endoglucanase